MQKFDLVKLRREPVGEKRTNVQIGTEGIVLKVFGEEAEVLFLNPDILGDTALVRVYKWDLKILKKTISEDTKRALERGPIPQKPKFNKYTFQEFDIVKVISHDYEDEGVMYGDKGMVLASQEALDSELVQFYEHGDTTLKIKCKDLQKLKTRF